MLGDDPKRTDLDEGKSRYFLRRQPEDAPQTFFSGEVVCNNLGVFIRRLEVALRVLVTNVALGPNAKPVADPSKKELHKVLIWIIQ